MLTRRHFLTALAATPLMPALTACATLPEATTTNTRIGHIDTSVTGTGQPAIVLLHGHGVTMTTWQAILPDMSQLSQTLAFNRPGYGDSDWRNAPRDATTIADEISAILEAARISTPVVVVGHSLGGLYAQAFARRFQDRTAGMVLIDSVVPGQGALLRRLVPDLAARVDGLMALQPPGIRREFRDSDLADAQLSHLPVYRRGRVVVLAASDPAPGVAPAYIEARKKAMEAMARDYAAQFKIIDSGHFIHQERPQAVLSALDDVIKDRT